MKKFFVIIFALFLFSMSAKADIMPYSVNDINPATIGVYQAENTFKIYKSPDETSEVLLEVNWNTSSTNHNNGDIFTAFYPSKNLAFIAVLDESDDMEWLEVLYKRNKKGWIKINDPYRYSNWRNFINDYGRKYGLNYLKGTPEGLKNLYGSPEDNSKIISTLTLPKAIKLTNVSGNWGLCIIYDIDNTQKIGWLKWRTQDGYIYMFPKIH